MKGYGYITIILLILFVTLYLSNSIDIKGPDAYSISQFEKDIELGNIRYVEIRPNV